MSAAEMGVDDYALRARIWIAEHMPTAPQNSGDSFIASTGDSDEDVLARIETCRDLQRKLYEGGFAGICVPTEYGGQGLSPAHQAAFNRELDGYDYPADIQASTFIPAMALLLEFGSEEQKLRHVPAMLRGEEIWVQFLSEPTGGSDAAGAVSTARRDGDHWVLNGSKIWTTAAWYGDWAICLARTDWDAEKHSGLTVFSFPVNTAGIDVHRIELVNGSREFCQEFLTDVVVPDTDRIGNVNGGWEVVTRWLHHERMISGGSMYVTGRGNRSGEGPYDTQEMIGRARTRGVFADARARALIGEAHALMLTRDALVSSVTAQMTSGMLPLHAAAMLRLFSGTSTTRRATIGMELCGRDGAVWSHEDNTFARLAAGYLARQVACIGGGTTEMARNVISERLLGMPREERADAGPFRDVPRGPRNV